MLLRAPFLNHLILEDWLLAQEVPELPRESQGQPVPVAGSAAHNSARS